MSFSRRQFKSTKGFTLIEVMIAVVILAVGLLALMAMQIVSIKANAFSSEMTYSTMLAQQQLETLRNLPFTDAALAAVPPSTPHTLPAIIDAKGGSYSVSWEVADTTTAMKTITLYVDWQSRRLGTAAEQQTIRTRMQTIVSQ
ncbi:MAG: prepilin-type N-terminal cleavage/methylation domain-containing protein [Deltaproteobacteria bacterium]|nr:prepilin-type N-terminal cleavage/methylation domain-containing protein [Deltaproteobacteria bacterium]